MDSDLDGISDTYTTTKTFISYMPNDNPLYSVVIVSPNISYQTDKNAYSYPINMYLARHISKILFDNQYILCYNILSLTKKEAGLWLKKVITEQILN